MEQGNINGAFNTYFGWIHKANDWDLQLG